MDNTGLLLIDKPADMTSHDVIDRLRRITGIRKIGHAGTLDPFATGLLLVAVSRGATKHLQQFVGLDKIYEAEFVIGATTETLDSESEIIRDEQASTYAHEQIETAMRSLTGDIEQVPPMYSAIKIGGKKLYDLARKGKEIERPPRAVTIHAFTLDELREENGLAIATVTIHCSSGTYVRALARDLGAALGTVGYTRQLRRRTIGIYDVANAVTLDRLTAENWTSFLLDIPPMSAN